MGYKLRKWYIREKQGVKRLKNSDTMKGLMVYTNLDGVIP